MTPIYHPSVQKDVSEVMDYYDSVSGPELGDALFEEFMAYVKVACENPTRFHPFEKRWRRVNLARFPYHFLYEIKGSRIRILVLRHNRRLRRGLSRR